MTSDPVRVTNYLEAADTLSTLAAVQALGAIVERREDELVFRGPGLRAAAQPTGVIDVGNAGTLLRLLPGWLAGQHEGVWIVDGDESIRRRPVDRIATPLEQMGAQLDAREDLFTPLRITGARLQGIDYDMPMASGQVKSCVLFAGLLASGATSVTEPAPTRDHTERMLRQAGARVERDGAKVTVHPQDELEVDDIHVPGDPSSIAFHAAAAMLVPGSRLVLQDVGVNWTRVGLPAHRAAHGRGGGGAAGGAAGRDPGGGADRRARRPRLAARRHRRRGRGGPARDRRAAAGRAARVLRRGRDDRARRRRAAAQGDRPHRRGRRRPARPRRRHRGGRGRLPVRGTGGLRGGTMEALGDHRLAMLGAVAGLASREGVEVVGMEAAAVSYPGFTADLERLLG